MEAEVVLVGGDAERVGDERMAVMAAFLPSLPGAGAQAELIRLGVGAGVKVEVRVHQVLVVRPVAAKQVAGVEIDDIGDEGEAPVRLRAGALKLVVAAPRG